MSLMCYLKEMKLHHTFHMLFLLAYYILNMEEIKAVSSHAQKESNAFLTNHK